MAAKQAKTPTWGYVVGVAMIVFGGCSASGYVQSINAEEMIAQQRSIMDNFGEAIKKAGEAPEMADSLDLVAETEDVFSDMDSADRVILDSVMSEMTDSLQMVKNGEILTELGTGVEKMMHISDYTVQWMVKFGYIGTFVSLLYLIAGAMLLAPKPYSIMLVYAALAVSLIFSVAQWQIFSADAESGLVSMISSGAKIFSAAIDLVLFAVVASSDKRVYRGEFSSEKTVDDF